MQAVYFLAKFAIVTTLRVLREFGKPTQNEFLISVRKFFCLGFFICLQFFISGQHTSSDDDFLYQQTKLAYPKAHQCVEKINHYLQQHYQKSLNQDEQLYLTIHIQRVVKSK